VLDEMHTYRGRQGADVALLVRRLREVCAAPAIQCVGTSATMTTEGDASDQREAVATVASTMFGVRVQPEHVIGETLERTTDPGAISAEALRQRIADTNAPADFRDLCIGSAGGVDRGVVRFEQTPTPSCRAAVAAADAAKAAEQLAKQTASLLATASGDQGSSISARRSSARRPAGQPSPSGSISSCPRATTCTSRWSPRLSGT